MMQPNLGLNEHQQQGVMKVMSIILADQHVLYTKLRNYHWNIVGSQFYALHELFEKQYNQIQEAEDTVAERIRAHGGQAVGTLTEFLELARLSEQPDEYPPARQMVINIVHDHEAMVRSLRLDAERCAEEYGDPATEDLLIGLMQEHQEMAWMLRSFVEGESVMTPLLEEEAVLAEPFR